MFWNRDKVLGGKTYKKLGAILRLLTHFANRSVTSQLVSYSSEFTVDIGLREERKLMILQC